MQRSEYEKLVLIMANPKTPGQWYIAMMNPYSTVSKLFQQICLMEVLEDVRLEILLERWIQYQEKRNQREREEWIRDQITCSILTAKNLQRAKEEITTYADEKLESKTLAQLYKIIEEYPSRIAELATEAFAIKQSIEENQQKITSAGTEIRETQQTILNEIRDNIINEGIPIFAPSGEELSQNKIEQVFARMTPPSPGEKVFKILHDKNPEDFNNKFDPQVQARKNNVLQQLNVVFQFSTDEETDEFNPFAALAFLREEKNKKFHGKWAEVAKDKEKDLTEGFTRLHESFIQLDQQKEKLNDKENEINHLKDNLDTAKSLVQHKENLQPLGKV